MKTGKAVLGVMVGLVSGVLFGILFAPEKGPTKRKQTIDKDDDFEDELKSISNKFIDTVKDKIETAKNEAEDLVSKGKEKYDDIKYTAPI